jgi:hypothetical protein
MDVHVGQRRSLGLGAIAIATLGVLLVAAACSVVYRMAYRLSAGGPRTSDVERPVETPASLLASERRSSHGDLPVPATGAKAPPGSATAASVAAARPENSGNDQPFIDARQERRDPVWARQMEWTVREALDPLRDRQLVLRSVQCASIRCTIEGTMGAQGRFEEVVKALSGGGLKRGRVKRVRGDDGTTTFTAVFAREGYKLDGSPKEDAAKPL